MRGLSTPKSKFARAGWTDERRKELTGRAVVGDLDGVIFKVKALRLPKVEEERIDKEGADA